MDEVSQIRDKIDIVSFISEFLPLKKAGRNFKTNCPFHNEKTPSFVISPERQIWHCFGCGKGGDAFTFLMEYENMEFPEALRILAKRTGIELRESEFKKGQSFEKEKIFEINKLSLKFYNYILNEHKAGKVAIDYLIDKRKLSKAIINTFEIGFAPAGNILSTYLTRKKNFKTKDLLTAGISYESGGRLFDFFRSRIIFPLYDHRGNVTGFSARALDETTMPKYINTKETPVYHKGSMFFGLNMAKDEIKKAEDAIIVEGEFDVVALFSEGIKNVVAIKGTALTEEQISLLSRFTPKVTLCLDQDNAGFEATKRSLSLLEKKGLTTNVIVIKDAKDPDEAVKKNPVGFKKSLKESGSIYDYLLSYSLSKHNKQTMEGKKQITDEVLPMVFQISNEIVKEHYIKKLSSEIDTSIESINKELDKFQNKEAEEKIELIQKDKRGRRELLEEYLLALVVQGHNPKFILTENNKLLSNYEFENVSYGKIIEGLNDYFKKNENLDNKAFTNFLSADLIKSFDFAYLFPIPKFVSDEKYHEEVKKVASELLNLYIKHKVKEVSDEIARNEKENKDSSDLKKEFAVLLQSLKQNQ